LNPPTKEKTAPVHCPDGCACAAPGRAICCCMRSAAWTWHDRSYRADRILGARVKKELFTPRYAVELGLGEPPRAPVMSRAAPKWSHTTITSPARASRVPSRFCGYQQSHL